MAKEAPHTDVLAEVGEAGRLEVVRIADLHLDHAYQRELSADLVDKIARNWDMAVAGAIVVSRRRSGELYIIDGQHRAAGAQEAGETEILARVIDNMTPKTEATLRLKGNTRRQDNSFERFRGQLVARNAESLKILDICEEFGTTVNRQADAKHGINAIAAVEKLYRRDRGASLRRVLAFLQETFGELGGANLKAAMLHGVAFMLDRHGQEMDRGRMVERLGEEGPANIYRMASAHKAALGGAMWMNYYRAFVEVYNHRLSQSQRLEWRTAGWSQRETALSRPAWAEVE